jgi:ankyrin repeat protein
LKEHKMSGFGLGHHAEAPPALEESSPWVAAGEGDLNLLKMALQQLNMPLSKPDDNGFTICHAAAAYNQVDVLRWILSEASAGDSNSKAALCNAQDSDGDTPLHHCDRVDVARILVNEGQANALVTNQAGDTPLQVKEEELLEAVGGVDGNSDPNKMDEDDDEDTTALRLLIQYLKEIATNPQ